jgi:hypothetical protein
MPQFTTEDGLTPLNIEAACVGCAIYESPARGQRVCPALERQIEEEADAAQKALLRGLVVAEAPGSPPGLAELVRREALRSRTPLLLPPSPSTTSVFSNDKEKEVPHVDVEVSRAVR